MSAARSARPRRRYPRLTLRVRVTIEAASHGSCELLATTLGAGGLFVACDPPLAPNTPLRVRFQLPGEDAELTLETRVAWSEPAPTPGGSVGMGLEFVDASARTALADLLERWAERNPAAI